jgi:hypothetical protein
VREIEKTLDYDKTEKYGDVEDHYRRLKEALTAHFGPSRNITYECHVFHKLAQDESESIENFVTRLRKQAKLCGFCDKACMDRNVRNQIVVGCRSERLRLKALEEDLTLERLMQIARAKERSAADAQKMEKPDNSDVADVNKVARGRGRYSKQGTFPPKPNAQGDTRFKDKDRKCFKCGGSFPHPNDLPCPAIGKTCHKCGNLDHFASYCRGRNRRGGNSAAMNVATDQCSSEEESYVGLSRGSRGYWE